MCALFLYADIYIIVRIPFRLWSNVWLVNSVMKLSRFFSVWKYLCHICFVAHSCSVFDNHLFGHSFQRQYRALKWNIYRMCTMTLISTDSRINANIYPELIKLITIAYKFGPHIPKCWAIYKERWFRWRILLVFPIFTYESWLFI